MTTNNAKKTTNKKSSELRRGDVVIAHGGRFELIEQIPCESDGVFAWKTVDKGAHWDDRECSIPKHWRDDWTIQGNDLIDWPVLIEG